MTLLDCQVAWSILTLTGLMRTSLQQPHITTKLHGRETLRTVEATYAESIFPAGALSTVCIW